MTPDRWQRLSELFDEAVARARGDREAFLAHACADDPTLHRELLQLLDSHERAGSFGEAAAFRFEARRERTLPDGSRLGRYEIRGFIGAGGMGEVYRAHDPQLERDVAIKILARRKPIGPEQLRRFEREARTIGALNHPNVLAVYDVGLHDGVPFVVSELLQGQTLREALDRGAIPATHALEMARQIAAGLIAAHEKGIVHRDLKPENLFLTRAGLVKVLDFGLAKQIAAVARTASGTASLTEDGVVMGTVGYMAPEQVRGQDADARSDIFALGAVLYEIVTGRRAFVGESAVETMHAILSTEPPALTGLAPPFDLVVQRCLRKERNDRFASMQEVAAALAAAPAPTAAPLIPAAREDRIRLAVLPWQNLGGDPEQEYFSDGLTDEMIAQLGRLNPHRLGVIARTSAMRYKHTAKSIDMIGRELGVGYVLEGSVRRSGHRVRVTAQLVRVSDQSHVWSDSYDREVGDLLALQSELAQAIAGEIQVQLTPEERGRMARRRPVDPAAYDAYLKGRYFWGRRMRESLEKSLEYFKEAIDTDPRYAAAYAGLADVYLTQFDYNHLLPREAFALANDAILDALRLDDTLAEPHSSLGHLRFHQFEFAAAEEHFRRAIELNPGYSTAHYYYANLLAALGRFDQAILEAHRALELDPMSANARQNRLFIYYLARRYDEALEQAHDTLELEPTYTVLHYWLGLVHERQHRYADALRAFEKSGPPRDGCGGTLAVIAFTHAAAGNRSEASRILERLEAEATRAYVSSYDLALIHWALGHLDRACALVDRAYEEHASFLPFLNIDARFDGLRSDPRFVAVVRRLKLPADTPMPAGEVPRLRRRMPMIAAGVAAAALAAAAWLVGLPGHPTGGEGGRPAVAILTFDNPTRDPQLEWLTRGVPDMLSIGLAETASLDVVSSQRTAELLREAGQPEHASGGTPALDVVRRAGADAIVAGAVYQAGNGFRVDVRIEDLAASRVMAAASVRGADVFALADDLVARLRTALEVDDQPAGRRTAEITTHSLEAFRLYTEGYAAIRGNRPTEARQALEAALRLDPGYALAHVGLSEAFGKFGDQKRSEEHLARAKALADRLSERDRLLVEAREAHLAGQTDRTIRALEAFVARWPAEDTAWDLYVHAYDRDPALKPRMLDVLQRWRNAVPGPGAGHMHNHFGYAYLEAGSVDEAIASFDAYRRVSPNEPNAHDSYAEALLVAARPDEAIRSYERALAINPTFGPSNIGRGWALGMEGRFDEALAGLATVEDQGERSGIGWRHVHFTQAVVASRAGRYRDAAGVIDRGMQLARQLQSRAIAVELHLAAAFSSLDAHEWGPVRAHARAALNLLDEDPARVEPLFDRDTLRAFAHFVLGVADVRTGRLAPAEREREAQRNSPRIPDVPQVWWEHALAGEIALARGDLAAAERLWRGGLPGGKMDFNLRDATAVLTQQLPQRDWEARLRRAQGDLAGAAAAYEVLNTPSRDTPWTALVEPRFVLERARLFQQMGDRQRAGTEYRRFLDLWRGADPDRPELAEARRYTGSPRTPRP